MNDWGYGFDEPVNTPEQIKRPVKQLCRRCKQLSVIETLEKVDYVNQTKRHRRCITCGDNWWTVDKI